MKITKAQLKKIIKEELEEAGAPSFPRRSWRGPPETSRDATFELLGRLTEMGADPMRMLEKILGDFLSGSEAHDAVMFLADEYEIEY
jgi:hypothetical protein